MEPPHSPLFIRPGTRPCLIVDPLPLTPHTPPPQRPIPPRPGSDVHPLSCPPLSIHLFQPPSYPPPHLQSPCSLIPLTYLHLPVSTSARLPVPPTHFTLFLSQILLSLFTFTLSILPPVYNFTPYVSIPLVLCHSLSTPHLLFHPP